MSFSPVAPERLSALRRMKLTATALLLAAAALYLVCRTVGDGHGLWGYVEAAAEASLVGGLADWFAVTALFRHPLRLPIPHTAIIPRKKDQIGAGLAGFVSQYFLTADVVHERVAVAQVPARVGSWLADPAHARQVSDELARAVAGAADVLQQDELRTAVATFADKRLRELDAAPLIARVIDALCDSGQHQVLLTTALRGTMQFLEANQEVFRQRLGQESPDWIPVWVDDRIFQRGFDGVQSFLADLISQPEHELRGKFDTSLRALAERLRTDPEQRARVEQAKLQLLEHPAMREWLGTLWLHARALIVQGAADPDSELRRGIARATVRIGEVLRDDSAVQGKVDAALQRVAGHIVTHYADDLAAVITTTVERWDTAETSRRLELQVGRDLQFIRINGTVVGALAGVVIHAISQLL